MEEITAKLASTFANQASTQADTFQGKMQRLQIAFDEGKETVGAFILDAITPLVEIVVNRVVPAIQEFTDNIGEKLQPVLRFIQPIINGVKAAFDTVRSSLQRNNEELQPFYNVLKNIGEFARDTLAPILGKILGGAIKALGQFISDAIDTFARFVSILTNVYNRIKSIVDAIKSVAGAVGGFFGASGGGGGGGGGSIQPASFVTPSTSSVPSISADIEDSDNRLRARAGITSITVNGAIDPESTARQIVSLLNDSSARGTLGGGLIYA
jgi:phage-related minor tail protein